MIRRVALASLILTLAFGGMARAQGFHALHSPDGLDVWAVGDAGTLYRSTNGGADFFSSTVGAAALFDVAARGPVALLAGADGRVWRSVNSGGAWTSQLLSGSPVLRALAFPTTDTAYVAGAAGAIWKSVDGGATWSPQSSGVGVTLYALRFLNGSTGWAVGAGGTVLRTTDGGASWNPVAVPTSNALRVVDQSGATVWIAGERGTCLRSTDGGANWTHVNLKLDAHADVRGLRVVTPDSIWIAGGGGFVRRSSDGGATWTFLQHRMHGALSDLAVTGTRAWIASSRHRAVFRTTNGGATWIMPTSMSVSQTFVKKLNYIGNVRGNSVTINPLDPKSFFLVRGDSVWASRDEGETWQLKTRLPYRVITPGDTTRYDKVNAFVVSPKDSNTWVLAAAGLLVSDRILRTTDAGAHWDTTLVRDYGEYGIPIEMHPDKPDTLYFGGESSVLYRSTNFGASWSAWMTDSVFRSPCDIVCVPDSSNIILVGDGITGQTNPPAQYYKSIDAGLTFELIHSRTGIAGASEIPGMACARLRNSATIGTNWSAGGVQRSLDYGASWPTTNPTLSQAWGVDIAKDDPFVAVIGQYAGNGNFFTYDGGATWPVQVNVGQIGNNYSYYVRDRDLVLAQQSQGLWKLQTTYGYTPVSSQFVNLNLPNGGETWIGGSVHNVLWSSGNIALARIEYRRTDGEEWQLVAEVPGYLGSYAWTVPYDATYDATLRVSDAWDGAPIDESDGTFIIQTPHANATPAGLDFGALAVGVGRGEVVTIENPGSGTLHVTGITHASAAFAIGRTSFAIGAGNTDTLGVWFSPAAAALYVDTLHITTDVQGAGSLAMALRGYGALGRFAALPDPLDLGDWNPGATVRDTLHIENRDDDTLHVTAVSVDRPTFYPGRTSFSIPPGRSDTLKIYWHPTVPGPDSTIVTIVASDTNAAHHVKVRGNARSNVAVASAAPAAFALGQNQPNPFGRSTLIRYGLPQTAKVTLEVFDLQGHRVATLVRATQSAGWYTATFGPHTATADGRRLASVGAGVYFYRLTAGNFTSTRKMLFVK